MNRENTAVLYTVTANWWHFLTRTDIFKPYLCLLWKSDKKRTEITVSSKHYRSNGKLKQKDYAENKQKLQQHCLFDRLSPVITEIKGERTRKVCFIN